MIYRGYIITRENRKINSREQLVWIAKPIYKQGECYYDTLLGFTHQEVKSLIDAERHAIKSK